MSFSSFAFGSLRGAYENLPTYIAASGLSAGVSYVANRFGSRLITLPAAGTVFKFSAAAYASWTIFKAFREEMTLLNQNMTKSKKEVSTSSSVTPKTLQGTYIKKGPSFQEIAASWTTIAVGARLVNSKFNPESTLLSFVKLSVTAALSLLALEQLKNFGAE